MPPTPHEIVSAFFADTADLATDLAIDEIDAWTILGMAPPAPTTICWGDRGRPPAAA